MTMLSNIRKWCYRSTVPVEDELIKDEQLSNIYEAITNYKDNKAIRILQEIIHEYTSKIKALSDRLREEIIHEYPSEIIALSDRLRKFRVKNGDSLDSLLHTAVLWNSDSKIVELLIKSSPDILTIKRTGSFNGQTALHMTLEKKRNDDVTKMILDNIRENDKAEVFSAKATGSKFKNNIMLGEIPLSIAVFRFDKDMVDLLIDRGARIDEVNSNGDSVVHSLIKYAALEHRHINNVIGMLKHLKNKVLVEKPVFEKPDSVETLWFKENVDRMTPLKLAVKEGLTDIVQYLLNTKRVFCLKEKQGSLDTRLYDITEIEPITQTLYSKIVVKRDGTKSNSKSNMALLKGLCKWEHSLSVIEMLSSLKWIEVEPLLDIEIIRIVISKRWKKCKIYYYMFGLVHLAAMFFFTSSAYYRKFFHSSDCNSTNIITKNDCQKANIYSQVAPWILFFYGLFLLAVEFYRLFIKGELLLYFKQKNNVFYRISLDAFALMLVIDCILYANGVDSNDSFVIILLSGTFFILFFFRVSKKFSYYTVLFQKIMKGDLIRFGIIIIIEFTAYSFAMYIILSGNDKVEQFSTFENTTLTMFGYMLGLKDLDFLDNVESQEQRLVAIIYVLYIITTYIILINSLIAMMSRTADASTIKRQLVTLLEKSSVAIFLSVFPHCRNDAIHDRIEPTRNRYYIEVTKEQMRENMNQKLNRENFTLKDVRSEFFPFQTRLIKDITEKDEKKGTNKTNGDEQTRHIEIEGEETMSSPDKYRPDIFDISYELKRHDT